MTSTATDLKSIFYPSFITVILMNELAQLGVDTQEVLRVSGIDERDLISPAPRVTYKQLQRFIHHATKSLDPSAAFHAGLSVQITDFGMWGFGLLSSESYRDAIRFGCKYQLLLGPLAEVEFSEIDHIAMWTYRSILDFNKQDREHLFSIEFHLSKLLAVLRIAFGPDIALKQVTLTYDEPAHAALYRQVFGCPILFNQPTNTLSMSAKHLDRLLMTANPITKQIVIDYCNNELVKIYADIGIEAHIRKLLMTQTERFPDIDEIAASLAMHPRTLRRKLGLAGTSYRKILTDMRKYLAIKYLIETDLTHSEIAIKLSFSDSASFRKAFKRWTNKQPSAYRRHIIEG
ncbi:AraC family transcriptional regulator [Aquirhabdus parva]|uniref:AraC family transcriptional regulator n=1 Tax=Aquirhabdus parva TaxID=2283318 RepID=A0A345P7X5_9GAMM|nr:AraC family transcriptional regulator [Aquirhabdus parva]AXI03384.1 AraC family transcriptional regulator [Aquirhabdus parva]